MVFIKKFRNGRPVDPTDPTMTTQPLTLPPELQALLNQQTPTPTPIPAPPQPITGTPKITAPPVRNVVTKKGGCGCGRK